MIYEINVKYIIITTAGAWDYPQFQGRLLSKIWFIHIINTTQHTGLHYHKMRFFKKAQVLPPCWWKDPNTSSPYLPVHSNLIQVLSPTSITSLSPVSFPHSRNNNDNYYYIFTYNTVFFNNIYLIS